jgi:hypothetical protein
MGLNKNGTWGPKFDFNHHLGHSLRAEWVATGS